MILQKIIKEFSWNEKKNIEDFCSQITTTKKKMHETFFPLSSLSHWLKKTIADSDDDEIFRNNNKEQKWAYNQIVESIYLYTFVIDKWNIFDNEKK